MGLDIIELVMELEDEFELRIPDAEAERLQTIGDTIDYFVSMLAKQVPVTDTACRTQQSFYLIRRGLVTEMKVARKQVRVDSQIGSLLTTRSQRRRWPSFARRHRLPVPAFSIRTERRFPNPATTIGNLARTAALRSTSACFNENGVDVEAVERKVLAIVADFTTIHAAKLTRDMHFIRDLNLD